MPDKPRDPIDLHIGHNIRFHRMRRGLSQAALGAAIGVTFQQVQKFERGVNRISASQLFHVAAVLRASIATFFIEDNCLNCSGEFEEERD